MLPSDKRRLDLRRRITNAAGSLPYDKKTIGLMVDLHFSIPSTTVPVREDMIAPRPYNNPAVLLSGGIGSAAVLWRCAYESGCTPVFFHFEGRWKAKSEKVRRKNVVAMMSGTTNSEGLPLASRVDHGKWESALTCLPFPEVSEGEEGLALTLMCLMAAASDQTLGRTLLVGNGASPYQDTLASLEECFGIKVRFCFPEEKHALLCLAEARLLSRRVRESEENYSEGKIAAGASIPVEVIDSLCSCPNSQERGQASQDRAYPFRQMCIACDACRGWCEGWAKACVTCKSILLGAKDFRTWRFAADFEHAPIKKFGWVEYDTIIKKNHGNGGKKTPKKRKTAPVTATSVDYLEEEDEEEGEEDEEENQEIDDDAIDDEEEETALPEEGSGEEEEYEMEHGMSGESETEERMEEIPEDLEGALDEDSDDGGGSGKKKRKGGAKRKKQRSLE